MPSASESTNVTVRVPTKLLQALDQLKREEQDEFNPTSRNKLICRAIAAHIRAERRRVSR